MMIYDFSKRGKLSKYEYLYQCLREDILGGTLSEGMKLPSKRAMASENHVSIRTVMNAYDQLIMEGYLIPRERSGYYVASDFSEKIRYQSLPVSLPEPEEEENWRADFTSNTIVYDRFPFSTWTKVMRQVLSDYHVKLMQRGEFLGSRELRAEIAKYLYRNRGMEVSPDCIVIGTGIEYLYAKLIRLLPEDAVYAVENPGYRKIAHIYEEFHVDWTWIDMDRDGISMSSLKKSGAGVVHTSPEHHYPLGTVMSARRRQELLKWLEDDPDRYIIEDDYDWEFRYRGRPVMALFGMDHSDRVIYMNTFSKTLSPAIRISYMVLPAELLRKYVSTANFFANTSSNLEQYTLARFIRDGYFDRHLNRMRKCYHEHGRELLEAVRNTEELQAEHMSAIESGTHLLVKVRTEMSDEEIRQKAAERGIRVHFLSDFCHDDLKKYENILVLNYLVMDQEMVREMAGELGKVIQEGKQKTLQQG